MGQFDTKPDPRNDLRGGISKVSEIKKHLELGHLTTNEEILAHRYSNGCCWNICEQYETQVKGCVFDIPFQMYCTYQN